MRVERLEFIGDHAPSLRAEAYWMALAELKQSTNYMRYESIGAKLTSVLNAFRSLRVECSSVFTSGRPSVRRRTWTPAGSKGRARRSKSARRRLKMTSKPIRIA